MNRITLLAVSFAFAVQLNAQNPPFPDGKFENCWNFVKNNTPKKSDYWDFKEAYFLSTLNMLHELEGNLGDAPLTAFKDSLINAYDGKYALRLVSNKMVLGTDTIFLPGVAATIFVDIMPPTCVLGEKWTSKPAAIKGYHKYTPVNGDSAAIEVILQKRGTVLGRGKEVIYEKVADWTLFNIPIEYNPTYTEETPDTIVVIFAASGNYDFTSLPTLMKCKGQKNSTLCLDNVEFEYMSGVKEMLYPEIKLTVSPNPSSEQINLQLGKETQGTVIIYDYLTRKMGEYPIRGTQIDINVQDYATGSYLINVVENDRIITTGRFLKE